MAKSSIVQLEKGALKRKLGILDLFSIGYGDLGSSIYYALGITAFFALGATPLALMLAGLVFICTALTYAEMTSAFKDSGGSASFARHAFNDLISFIAGWGLLLDYIVTIAISIFAIAPYLSHLYLGMKSTSIHLGFSVCLIAVLFVLNIFGVKHSTRVSLILTGFTLVTQLVVVLIGLGGEADFSQVFEHMRINVTGQSWSPTWSEFWKGTAMAMVAYTGIESIAQLGSETKQPIKTLPRAVMMVMFVLLFMYLGISMVSLSVLTPQELGTTYVNDPLAGITAHLPFGGAWLTPWIGILAALLLFVAGNAGLLGASRLAYNMGEYYQLPRFFSRTHSKYKTPIFSLAIFGGLAALLILISRGFLDILADLYNFGAMIAFFSAHASLIVLRFKQPNLKRPFRLSLNIRIGKYSVPITAIIGALTTLGVWILIVVTKPEGRYVGFAWMFLGLLMYLAYRKKQRIAPAGQLQIEKIKISEYGPIVIKQILVPTKGPADIETIQFACELAKLHKAKITSVHVVEVPPSVPLDAPLPQRIALGQAILLQAEAIAREFDLSIETIVIRAREIDDAILQVLSAAPYDLLVIGAMTEEKRASGIRGVSERIMRGAPCRVIVCSGAYKE